MEQRKSGGPKLAAYFDSSLLFCVPYLATGTGRLPRLAAYFFSNRSMRPAVSTSF
jgi:hypothetical protein